MALPEGAKVKHYKELKIWQKGMALTKEVYRVTERFPAAEKYGLAAQLRRAAVSVPSNIAEGQARRGTREFLQFLSHASGSLAELETQVLLSVDLGYRGAADVSSISREIAEPQKMLAAIRRKLAVF
ncbi:MAG TPA: four helix bundle protein [Candidatus Acidoferrales bacterium]|nr:four helix bundle protein [Candidatus Acidoferrales bacterium]